MARRMIPLMMKANMIPCRKPDQSNPPPGEREGGADDDAPSSPVFTSDDANQTAPPTTIMATAKLSAALPRPLNP